MFLCIFYVDFFKDSNFKSFRKYNEKDGEDKKSFFS